MSEPDRPPTTYYKAVRPDGRNFATATVEYRLGEWTPRIEGELTICERGYHASDAPAATLVGGSWPCRLFVVEAEGIAKRQSFSKAHPRKLVCRSLRPVEELPAWQALGPNGEAVAALIERAGRLTQDETNRLYAARDVAWYAARDAAWNAAGDAARDAARDAAWYAAWNAAWNAALALVARDLITPEQFDLLYGPWKEVVG